MILLGGAVDRVPETITHQLADGGRMLAVITHDGGVGKATLFVKTGEIVGARELFDAAVPPLPGFQRERSFAF